MHFIGGLLKVNRRLGRWVQRLEHEDEINSAQGKRCREISIQEYKLDVRTTSPPRRRHLFIERERRRHKNFSMIIKALEFELT